MTLKTKLKTNQQPNSSGENEESFTKCDYISSSEQCLRIHSARKHTVNKEDSSNGCELCEKKFDTVKIF